MSGVIPIINESTSILQLNTAGLQNGSNLIVYVSSTSIPGQLVTILDATGYLSSPQSIRLSTVGSASINQSAEIQQRYGYISIASQDSNAWVVVAENSFPTTNPISYRTLDTPFIQTSTLNAYAYMSTANTRATGVDIAISAENGGQMFASTMNVNSYQAYLSTSITDPRLRIWGSTHVYGSTTTIGTVNIRGNLSMSGSAYVGGNISSKLGTIYIEGNVTTQGSIRGQRGNQITAQSLSAIGSASFNLSTNIASNVSVSQNLTTKSMSSLMSYGNFLTAASSIVLGSGGKAIQYKKGFLNFLNIPATIPSVSTNFITSSNATTTSNLIFQSFGPASTLRRFDMSGAQISNADGSLQVSSIAGSFLSLAGILSKRGEARNYTTTNSLAMNDLFFIGSAPITYPPNTSTILGTSIIPMYWCISSIGNNGSLLAPNRSFSTNILSADLIKAKSLITQNDIITSFRASSMTVTNSIFFSSANYFSLKGVELFNIGGSIKGSKTEIAANLVISTIQTDLISSATSVNFYGNNDFSLSTTSISSLASGTILTSSFAFTNGLIGDPVLYSTMNPSTSWLQASTFNMGSSQFTKTSGLGTYFDQAVFSAAQSQTAYYSIINPLAQPMFLSTPYINTIIRNTGYIAGQPAIDRQSNIYFGADSAGWRLQKINSTNTITTVGGANQFFYGDGQYPTSAALGPKLSVSVVSPGTILITDISNVRLRFVDIQPIIQTIAGTGASGYSGDGGLAYNATFLSPMMTSADSVGNIFVADSSGNMIRKISASTITRYAGNLTAGASGDGGPALAAKLAAPYGLATDSSDLLYITDTSNCVIRTVSSGSIQRFAGSYSRGFSGDGGLATTAQLSYPTGITTDFSKNVYVCDTGNKRIRRIDYTPNIISTIAGNGTEGFSGNNIPGYLAALSSPTGVAADLSGNIYIVDTNNNCIRSVNAQTGLIRTIAGRPPLGGYAGNNTFATTALLSTPSQVAYDKSSGFLYFSDDGNRRIRFVVIDTGIIYDYVGNGSPFSYGNQIPASNAIFGSIAGVATDLQDNLYVADGAGNIIRKIDSSTGIITSAVGTGGGGFTGDGAALSASISTPRTMITDLNNNLLFCDTNNHRIRKYISTTRTVQTVAGTGIAGYDGDGVYASTAQLNYPKALALDASGNLFIGDSSNYRIRRVDATTGIITTFAGTGVSGTITAGGPATGTPISFVTALTADPNNTLYLTDLSTNGLWQIRPTDGTFQPMNTISTPSYLGDGGPLSNAQFNGPMGLITDAVGNFIVADSGNNSLRRSYTYGIPQLPAYLNMYMNFTNYYAISGTTNICVNGNPIASFNTSSVNSTFSMTDMNVYNYPLPLFINSCSISFFNFENSHSTI